MKSSTIGYDVFMIMYNTYFKTNVFCKLLAIQLAFSISIEHIGKEPKLSLNNRFNVKKLIIKYAFNRNFKVRRAIIMCVHRERCSQAYSSNAIARFPMKHTILENLWIIHLHYFE